MNVVFAVSSQAELVSGLPWVQRFCESSSDPASSKAMLLIVRNDPATLLSHATDIASEHDFVSSVDSIDAEVDSLVEHARSHRPDLLVLVADHDNDAFQKSVFHQSPSATVWIRPHGGPPALSQQIFCIDSSSQASVTSFCNRLLGHGADLALLNPTEFTDSLESNASSSLIDTVRDAQQKRCEAGDVIAVDCSVPTEAHFAKVGFDLISKVDQVSVLLYHRGETVVDTWAGRLRDLASRVAQPMDREQRIELSTALKEGSQPNLEFLGLISASSMLAAFGLLQDSAAVIIGAMLIAPLMTPILGAGLSLSHGNRPLFKASLTTIALGFLGALGSSFLFGLLVRFTQGVSVTGEMWARCQPTPLDFCVGLVGGIAASYARTRRHLSSALAGAAIAAALVPPLSTAGLQLAFGQYESTDRGTPVLGPLLLVTINVLTIMVGSSFVLYLRGLRSDRSTLQKDRWGLRVFVLLVTLACIVMASLI